jgi:phosphonate transport system permease protein
MTQMQKTLNAKSLSSPLSAAPRPSFFNRQMLWVVLFFGLLVWALLESGVFQNEVVNSGGFNLALKFLSASLQPELSGEFIRLTLQATMTTLAFAVAGLFLSVIFGFFGGIFASHTWAKSFTTARADQELPPIVRLLWLALRWFLTLFRSVHEIIWALIFVAIIGLDPLSAILAIAIPFAAIIAKVFSEIIDEADHQPFSALLNSGVSPAKAFIYALQPTTFADMLSYSFYRFECAIRAAAVLGIVGVGGLGYQIFLSLQTLKFPQIWTLLIALLALNGLADLWSSILRRRLGVESRCDGRCLDLEAVHTTRTSADPIYQDRVVRISIIFAVLLVPLSFWYISPDLGKLFSERTFQNMLTLAQSAFPPNFAVFSLVEWVNLSRATLAMSFLGVSIASLLAILLAFPAANIFLNRSETSDAQRGGRVSRFLSATLLVFTRGLLLVLRSIPAPIWALLLLFILFPGILPGALALGIYTLGVLGRLLAEVVENLDQRPLDALKAQGASRAGVFMYGALPPMFPRFVSYFLYRWEEIIRATVVVGLVGAGGLGRSLTEHLSGFNYPAVLATLLVFILITFIVDLVSQSARKTLRQVG